jgi:hypothetical protein
MIFQDLTSFGPVEAEANLILKLHAVSMILAWILCANLGAFVARYCKTIFGVGESFKPLEH